MKKIAVLFLLLTIMTGSIAVYACPFHDEKIAAEKTATKAK